MTVIDHGVPTVRPGHLPGCAAMGESEDTSEDTIHVMGVADAEVA